MNIDDNIVMIIKCGKRPGLNYSNHKNEIIMLCDRGAITIVAIIVQYINVSYQHVVHFTLIYNVAYQIYFNF